MKLLLSLSLLVLLIANDCSALKCHQSNSSTVYSLVDFRNQADQCIAYFYNCYPGDKRENAIFCSDQEKKSIKEIVIRGATTKNDCLTFISRDDMKGKFYCCDQDGCNKDFLGSNEARINSAPINSQVGLIMALVALVINYGIHM